MTDKQSEALRLARKPCEYCGHDLPEGVNKKTRQERTYHFKSCDKRPRWEPLYTAPPQREWQGLTDEDLSVCDEDGVILARYWEAKLKEKNT